MAIYTCAATKNDAAMQNFNPGTRELILAARAAILNKLEDRMARENYPERMRGRTGVKLLTADGLEKLNREVAVNFAKGALAASESTDWHGTDDISILANEMVHEDAGVQRFVTNAIRAILTPLFPAVQSNAFDMLCETRYGGIGETFEFDIPSSEVYMWSAGARGSRSYAHDQREADTLTLNPKPVGTTFDIPWIRIARGDYDFAGDMLAALLGWGSYTLGVFAKEITAAATELSGTAYHAPSYSPSNFLKVKSNVAIANGNMGQVFCLGTETALSKVLPETDAFLYGVGSEHVKMGFISQFARTPLIELQNAFVPGTYAGDNPAKVLSDDKLLFFASGGEKPVKMAIGGDMVTVVRDAQQKSNKVTSYTMETEMDMGLVTGARWGVIEGVV